MFTLVTVTENDEVESGVEGHRFGITVRDIQNLCTAKGLKHAVITQTALNPGPPPTSEINYYIERGVDVLIVDQG